jgi:hypothetical protein
MPADLGSRNASVLSGKRDHNMPERLPYDEAMLFAASRLKMQDPELKQGKVETITFQTAAGTIVRPWGIEGGFAVVYKFRTKSGNLRALRCFRVPMNPDTRQRYELIGPYFLQRARDITAGFKYHDIGIVVKETGMPQNKAYPVIEMDWVEGVTLLEKVDELCKKRDCAALKRLLEQWVWVLQVMRDAKIAHGDLAAVNVMVRTDDRLMLIDYDGVYIPPFAGFTQILLGQVDYQHPHVARRRFDEHMDIFSALVIYTALCALQASPELWHKYMKRDDDGKLLDTNLLFSFQDYKNPHQSALIQELEKLGDPQVKAAVQELKQACLMPIEQIRWPLQLLDPYYKQHVRLQELERAIQADDDKRVLEIWDKQLENFEVAQQHRGRVQLAQKRDRALSLFQAALASKGIQRIVSDYDSMLNTYQRATHYEKMVANLARTFQQAFYARDDRQITDTYAEAKRANLLDAFHFTPDEQSRIDLAHEHIRALEDLRSALKGGNIDHIVSTYAPETYPYQGLTDNERQQAKLASDYIQAHKANQAQVCFDLYKKIGRLYRVLPGLTEDQERLILPLRRQEALSMFHTALMRHQLRQIVESYDPVLDASAEVTETARDQLTLACRMVGGFDKDDDEVIVKAWHDIQQSLHHNFFLLSDQELQRLQLAQKRRDSLERFRQALSTNKAKVIVAAYDASLLDECASVTSQQRKILDDARSYSIMYDNVKAAIRASSDIQFSNIYDPKLDALFTDFTVDDRQFFEKAKDLVQLRQALRQKAFGDALKLANDSQREISNRSLRNDLSIAVRKFIEECGPNNVTLTRKSDKVEVRWEWPASTLVQDAILLCRTDTWPRHPQYDIEHREEEWIHLPRRNNQVKQVHTLLVDTSASVYILLCTMMRDEWARKPGLYFSSGVKVKALTEEQNPQWFNRKQTY